jgi:hypothetical protein
MPGTEKTYRRLPGKKSSFLIGYITLWIGEDHLLSIDSKRFSEDYKRFYYQDIQSITIRKTVVGKVQSITLGLLCLGFFLLGLFTGESQGWQIFARWLFGLCLLGLVINLLRGPTSVCHLQTAVQTTRLPSLNRMKNAQKALNLLKPLIAKAQGALDPNGIEESKPIRSRVAGRSSEARASSSVSFGHRFSPSLRGQT